MKRYELKDFDSEDFEVLLGTIESSFDIRFEDEELAQITNFGQFCDHVTAKIKLEPSNTCTSQQAFYKLRNSLSIVLGIESRLISPQSLLADLMPRKTRNLKTEALEEHLGFETNILRPPHWVSGTLAIILLASFFSIFGFLIHWEIGLAGLIGFILSLTGFAIANKFGNELDLKNVGQVAEKIAREHYLKTRRHPNTFNKQEVEAILTDLFIMDLDLDKTKLTRVSTFI